MNIFLSFIDKQHRESYARYYKRTGQTSFKSRITSIFIYAIFLISIVYTKAVLSDPQALATRRNVISMIAIGIIIMILTLLYILSRRATCVKRNLHVVLNYLPWAFLLPATVNALIQLNGYTKMDSTQVLNVDLIGNMASYCVYIMFLGVLFPTNFVVQILFLWVSFLCIFVFFVKNTYLTFWIDFARNIGLILCITSFLYYRESHSRQMFITMTDALEEANRWRSIIGQISEGVIGFDDHLAIIYANEKSKEILCNQDEQPKIADFQKLKNQLKIFRNLQPTEHSRKVLSDLLLRDEKPKNGEDISGENLLENIGELYFAMKSHHQSGTGREFVANRCVKLNFTSSVIHHPTMTKLKCGEEEEKRKKYEISITLNTGTLVQSSICAVLVIQDITERLENLALKEASEYKTRLLASVSHELRTPLNGSIAMLEAANNEEGVATEVKTELLQPALDCMNYLLCLINDILDASQLHQQKLRLSMLDFNLRELVRDVVRLITLPATKKGLCLKIEIDERVPQTVFSDRNRMKQVLLNLLSNSLKFTFKGHIHLDINHNINNNVVKFQVSDTGIGIKDEDRTKLFSAFGKVDSQENMVINPNGVGLGLAISNSLVKMLGGTEGLTFESEYGKGSTFWFELPILLSPTSSAGSNSKQYTDNESHILTGNKNINMEDEYKNHDDHQDHVNRFLCISRSLNRRNSNSLMMTSSQLNNKNTTTDSEFKLRLHTVTVNLPECSTPTADFLIVDDNEFNIQALRLLLKSYYSNKIAKIPTFDCAYNGAHAIEKVHSNLDHWANCLRCQPYSYIFMDCDMPVMDGMEAARILKASMQANKDLPYIKIIACTAFSSQEEIDKCLSSGMDDHLVKPVNQHQLALVMERKKEDDNEAGDEDMNEA